MCGADVVPSAIAVTASGSSPRVRSGLNRDRRLGLEPGIISACAERTRSPAAASQQRRDHLRVCGADGVSQSTQTAGSGSSPRVRSGQTAGDSRFRCPGIISACAERTNPPLGLRGRSWDHLRVCGADGALCAFDVAGLGSSPRVRSGLRDPIQFVAELGIISACAERTYPSMSSLAWCPDHLRVCGADCLPRPLVEASMGSSPRVRSGPRICCYWRARTRIISACAERTVRCPSWTGEGRDHLRVCGADCSLSVLDGGRSGSSPRVRSGHRGIVPHAGVGGIISACAERTVDDGFPEWMIGDHLRVCGADEIDSAALVRELGSSPRVRSGLDVLSSARRVGGIISACAERTWWWASRRSPGWDHLRVCGADYSADFPTFLFRGSSPRVRSGQDRSRHRRGRMGIISACAERTESFTSIGEISGDHLRVCGADL